MKKPSQTPLSRKRALDLKFSNLQSGRSMHTYSLLTYIVLIGKRCSDRILKNPNCNAALLHICPFFVNPDIKQITESLFSHYYMECQMPKIV